MTSPPPLLYDTYYHIYNRGVNRENIFFERRNYSYFWKLYEKYIAPVVDTFGYCLLKNHFHILIRVKAKEEILDTEETLRTFPANGKQRERDRSTNRNEKLHGKPPAPVRGLGTEYYVSNQFSNFFNAYAKAINKVYHRTGSLFQHPFGRVPVRSDRQFWNVIAYIHQNPQKHAGC